MTTLRDGSDASRRRWRFATAATLRDPQGRFATSATLRDGNDASRRRRRFGEGRLVGGADGQSNAQGRQEQGKKAVGRAAGGQSKEGKRAEAGGAGKSWTAVCNGGGWRDGRDGGRRARF